MCLITTTPIPKIADKDIICYKLVKRTKIKGVYKARFQEFEYIIRQLYTNNINVGFIRNFVRHHCFLIYSIEEGMFHSYVSSLCPIINTSPNWTVLKCIIPKGAYYYEGYFSNSPSYASSQIKILEEICDLQLFG